MSIINVGVGDMQAAATPAAFRTILGSCVGIALYDPICKAGGLAHIMLPLMRNGDGHVPKYANTAIPALVAMLERDFGVTRRMLRAKLAGGATMFAYKKHKRTKPMLDIGNNNIKACRFCLDKLKIPIVAEDLGKDYGRRMQFNLDNGAVQVRTQGQETVEL